MHTKNLGCSITMVLLASLSATIPLSAQNHSAHKSKHHQYKLIDLGTLGGPNSFVPSITKSINSSGTVIVEADKVDPDPYSPNCFEDCFVNHAAQWREGFLTDLGALPGSNSSFPAWISDRGTIAGFSENGAIDPLTGFPEVESVVWNDGQIIPLEGLGGNASYASSINNRGQVAGQALNTTPDSFASSLLSSAFFPVATQWRAVRWNEGELKDLGTLGGPDSAATLINDRGQISGVSFTTATPNTDTGIPTQDPFFWDGGKMVDIGTLGGTFGFPYALNNRGQVTGQSYLAGDVIFHPFLWTRGSLKDLGTLGGDTGSPRWLNDAGEVVGRADIPTPSIHHAFLWKNNVMTDLGTLAGDPCSTADGINSKGQIVGISAQCNMIGHGFLWENGGPMVDLQSLVRPGSDLTISEVYYISDRGEIGGFGADPSGNQHALLLIPCDKEHRGECDDDSLVYGSNMPSIVSYGQSFVRPESIPSRQRLGSHGLSSR